MKYFLHDSAAMQDEKVTKLFIEFGYTGTGLFFAVLEKIAYSESPIEDEILRFQLKIKGKKLNQIYDFLFKIELLFMQNDKVFNENVLKVAEKYKINKEKNRKRVLEWRKNQEDTENVTHYEQIRNNDVTLANKTKENKTKENNNNDSDNDNDKTNIYSEFQFFKDEFKEIWINEFLPIKKKKKASTSDRALTSQLNKIKKLSNDKYMTALQILEKTVNAGYTDFYELKTNNNFQQPKDDRIPQNIFKKTKKYN